MRVFNVVLSCTKLINMGLFSQFLFFPSPEACCCALGLLPAPTLALVEREVADGVVGVAGVVHVRHLLEGGATCKGRRRQGLQWKPLIRAPDIV